MNHIFTFMAGVKMDSRHMEIIQDLFFRFLLNILSVLLKSVLKSALTEQRCVQQLVITTACTAVESAVQNGPQQLHHYVAKASFMKTQLGRGPIYPNAFFSILGSH